MSAARPLGLEDIVDQRAYERERDAFRAEVIATKRVRRVGLGPVVSVVFENRLTVRFQIQEMARAEKMVTDQAIETELDTYNPLIPARGELSMTLFLELTTDDELRKWLPALVGIEDAVVLRIGDGVGESVVRGTVDPTHASQLTRDTVTASVHYVRIQLDESEIAHFSTEPVSLEIDHPAYAFSTSLAEETKNSLLADW